MNIKLKYNNTGTVICQSNLSISNARDGRGVQIYSSGSVTVDAGGIISSDGQV